MGRAESAPLLVRFTPEEKAALDQAASKAGKPLGVFVRDAVAAVIGEIGEARRG